MRAWRGAWGTSARAGMPIVVRRGGRGRCVGVAGGLGTALVGHLARHVGGGKQQRRQGQGPRRTQYPAQPHEAKRHGHALQKDRHEVDELFRLDAGRQARGELRKFSAHSQVDRHRNHAQAQPQGDGLSQQPHADCFAKQFDLLLVEQRLDATLAAAQGFGIKHGQELGFRGANHHEWVRRHRS